MNQDERVLATTCGLFHDIGKLTIPDSITKKPDKLTDEEYKIMKNHTVAGFQLLQKQDVDDHIKNAALMHHEKCDGSGYPLGLKGDKIDPYAKLVAIADVYDAMTSARVYRGALCPFTVIEVFEDEGLSKYDVVYIMTFLENVINTYIDNMVQLSDGRKGIIKWIDKQNLSKPMVQLLDGTFLELAKHKDLKIVKIL
jgi:putative nucleotidyltransferase with HDIG domain